MRRKLAELAVPEAVKWIWSTDFIQNQRFQLVVLGIEIEFSLRSEPAIRALRQIIAWRWELYELLKASSLDVS